MNVKEHGVRVAVAQVLLDIVTEGNKGVRAAAEQVFGAARRTDSTKSLDVELDGVTVGTLSILAGKASKTVNHSAVAAIAAARHGTVEVFRPGALEDENLLAFVRDQMPHLLETKVHPDHLSATYKQIDKNGHLKAPDGTKVPVATTERGAPTGAFQFRPNDDARDAVLAAWQNGQLQDLFAHMVQLAIEAGERS